MKERWSDYCSDLCAYCDEPMRVFADTYEFNLHFVDCPHCYKLNQSGFVNNQFVWIKVANEPSQP
jgi:hypothetical protein